ncbi:hypothetical protein OQA88_6308 [Cercophora sp. LCS_1]
MASQLPPFPRLVFTVLEPISLLAGVGGAILDPDWFMSQQVESSSLVIATPQSRIVTQQLGNCYFLAFVVAIAVLYTTSEVKVVRNYLVALWIADITHIGISAWGLGLDRALAVQEWNAMAWGNIGCTVMLTVKALLFLTRTAYFLGLFGPDKLPLASAKKGE